MNLDDSLFIDKQSRSFDKEQAIQWILNLWEKASYHTVANDRRRFEATKWGQRVIRSNPDRHLYAMRVPTKEENLTRIANVFREMDFWIFIGVLKAAGKIRRGKH